MATHLVTGGSGFLGNIIARRLFQRGENVRILDIWRDPLSLKEIEFFNCDIRDRSSVAKTMNNVDYVHHTAALVPITKSGKKFWEVNVEGSKIVAEEAVKMHVKCFIYMSSSTIFGIPQSCPITDETPTRPIETYGRTKLAGELAVKEICYRNGLPLIIVRPRTIIGEGRLGIFQILFDWIKDGRNVYVIGSGNVKFQSIHAIDLMDFYMLALDKGKPGIYNVGTDGFKTLRETLENLISYAGTNSKVISLPIGLTINTLKFLDFLNLSPLVPWHYLSYHKDFYFDVEPLLKLGWKPKYSNDAMFKESYDWYINNYNNSLNSESGSPHRNKVKEKLLWLIKQFS